MAIIKKTQDNITRANQLKCSNLIVKYIRERYSINEELAVLRQRASKPDEYAAYNEYVEQCKTRAKANI